MKLRRRTYLIENINRLLSENKDRFIKKLPNLSDDEKGKVIEFFKKKANLENKIDWNNKKLTFADFKKVMELTKTDKKRKVKKSGISGLRKGKDYIQLETPEGVMDAYIPLDWEASKLIASNKIGGCVGKWCTAYQKDVNYWIEYIYDYNLTPIYFVSDKDKFALMMNGNLFHSIWNRFDKDFKKPHVIDVGFDNVRSFDDFVKSNSGLLRKARTILDERKPLHWFEQGLKDGTIVVKDADYEIKDVEDEKRLIWHDGTWVKGEWQIGEWHDGEFLDGEWLDGIWINGNFRDGIWRDGVWYDGIFHDGIWNKGTWRNGEFLGGAWDGGNWRNGIWRDGIWYGGIFHNGNWFSGSWLGGIFENGYWHNGEWDDGKFNNALWKNGTWNNGKMAHSVWENGTWKNGICYKTMWSNGTWEDGEFKNSLWSNGTWHGGEFNNSHWKDGIWNRGIWLDGEWADGTWITGYDKNNVKHTNPPNEWDKETK